MAWVVEQVLALAPDASSAKSGKELSAPRKWVILGATDQCAWGSIQGSGNNAYQVCIDLSGPAFKCTCPSRKFPCKHGLGLFLILAQAPGSLTETAPPAWASEWLAKRAEKEERKSESTAPAATRSPEEEAKAAAAAEKRAASRESKVAAGLEDLQTWLHDLVRTGFATLPGRPSSFWQNPAARLVDAQAPGLARRVRALDGITTTGEQWPGNLLAQAALLDLVHSGWTRMAMLPEGTQADLRSTIGFTLNQEEVLALEGVRDQWLVIGQRIEEEDRLRVQRTWLFGQKSGRPALCLSFSAGPAQQLDVSLVPGATIDAELAFFPSAWPLRALVKQRHGFDDSAKMGFPHDSIARAISFAAEAFTANPWLEQIPFAFSKVVPLRRTHGWIIRDEHGHFLSLEISDLKAWSLLAVSGGNPVSLSGEWNGAVLRPLGMWKEGSFLQI